MTPSAHEFLAELYQLDPDLKAHEDELLPLIERLLQSDPAQSPDPQFVATLRRQLQDRAAVLSKEMPLTGSPRVPSFFYFLSGALTIAILLPVGYLAQQRISAPHTTSTESPMFAFQVQDAGKKEAFGSLSDVVPGAANTGMGGGGPSTTNVAPMADQALPKLGDPGTRSALAPGEIQPPAPEMGMKESNAYGTNDVMVSEPDMKRLAVPYPMVQYQYVYDGKLPDLTPTVSVYRHDVSSTAVPLSTIAAKFNFGAVNIGSFAGTSVDSLTFSQNVPFGYQFFINLRDSSVNIDAQWDQWPMSKCTTDACYQKERVTIGDIPSDDALIAIAQSFVDAHGIVLSQYGKPEVDNSWKLDYERAADKSTAYVPDTIRVIYPLLIDGKPVLDQSGMSNGISVGIQVKQKKVMNVYGIMDRNYTKSDYTGVTDPAAITTYLSKVDNYGPVLMDSGTPGSAPSKAKTVKVVLGDPTVSYSLYYRYADGQNEELVIPSLVFPVKEAVGADANSYYRHTVVVPLAKELLDEQSGGGVVRPMMMEKAVR